MDKQRRPLQFAVGDHVYLKVSPMRGVHWFGVHGKLAPQYVGPYKVFGAVWPSCLSSPTSRYFISGTQCVSCILVEKMFVGP